MQETAIPNYSNEAWNTLGSLDASAIINDILDIDGKNDASRINLWQDGFEMFEKF